MPNRQSRNVSLTAELDRFIEDRLAAGEYGNASEVVRTAIKLLRDREAPMPLDSDWLHASGECADLIRSYNWSASPLGDPAGWSPELRVTVCNIVNSPVPKVLMWGPKHIMIYNDGYSAIAGGYHPNALGGTVPDIWPEIWDFNREILECGFRGEVQEHRDRTMVVRRNGVDEEVVFDLFYTPVRVAGGKVGGVMCTVIENTDKVEAERRLAQSEAELRQLNETLEARVIQEIGERRQAEAELAQAQKMETIGKLTGGVAHDFNNLLQVVSGNLQMLAKDVSGNERAERRVTNAMAGVSRGAKLAAQLLAFGRRQALEPKVVNATRFVRDMDDMLRRAIGEGIEVETIVGGGLWNTFIDPTQIENALLNLAINARDAMEGQGKLTIELGNASLDDDYARQHVEVSAGQYVMLAVTDTGCGMSPDIVEKVFEPFFSTKSEGKGSGLGLSMVYGFVKQSGGHVKIYSEVGEGTTIKLYLPRADAPEDIEVDVDGGPTAGGTETVLVVEDDDEVRATVVEMLGDLGYRVLKAVDAGSALSVIESGIPIDMLFTDVVMPGRLKSPELARMARERLPDLAVLFTSGYTENSIVHGGKLDAGVELLSKPYSRETLARKFRHVLANQQQRNQARKGQQRLQDTATSSKPASTKLNVLLVEDDELIRSLSAEMLTDTMTVITAASAEDAVTALQTVPIDVLVTDVNLPGRTGPDLAEQARTLRPGLGIVFATGDSAVAYGKDDPTVVVLQKPFDEAALAKAIGLAVVKPVPGGSGEHAKSHGKRSASRDLVDKE